MSNRRNGDCRQRFGKANYERENWKKRQLRDFAANHGISLAVARVMFEEATIALRDISDEEIKTIGYGTIVMIKEEERAYGYEPTSFEIMCEIIEDRIFNYKKVFGAEREELLKMYKSKLDKVTDVIESIYNNYYNGVKDEK